MICCFDARSRASACSLRMDSSDGCDSVIGRRSRRPSEVDTIPEDETEVEYVSQ